MQNLVCATVTEIRDADGVIIFEISNDGNLDDHKAIVWNSGFVKKRLDGLGVTSYMLSVQDAILIAHIMSNKTVLISKHHDALLEIVKILTAA